MYQANFVAVSGGIVTLSAVRDNNNQAGGQTLNYLTHMYSPLQTPTTRLQSPLYAAPALFVQFSRPKTR